MHDPATDIVGEADVALPAAPVPVAPVAGVVPPVPVVVPFPAITLGVMVVSPVVAPARGLLVAVLLFGVTVLSVVAVAPSLVPVPLPGVTSAVLLPVARV